MGLHILPLSLPQDYSQPPGNPLKKPRRSFLGNSELGYEQFQPPWGSTEARATVGLKDEYLLAHGLTLGLSAEGTLAASPRVAASAKLAYGGLKALQPTLSLEYGRSKGVHDSIKVGLQGHLDGYSYQLDGQWLYGGEEGLGG